MDEIKALVDCAIKYNELWKEADSKGEACGIELCGSGISDIHIYSGIEKVAELYNAALITKLNTYEDGSQRIEKFFKYEGIRIFELFSVEEE